MILYDRETYESYDILYLNSSNLDRRMRESGRNDCPDLDKIRENAKKNGFDTVEIITTTEKIERYEI